ncbi:hypothetical protein BBP00_00006443 [Phytophthora kernoviae]|uniref:Thaumatin-like protein n=1 Tax=Phytophthora kernoviae TaxID=325452 RepID=A0A3F2RKY7_9STRA|nr:hypothetical protein BBP00_00006443 [Phytophthora kernoviae]
MVWRSSVSAVVAVAVGLIAQAQAFEVTLVNSCSESIVVFDSKSTETLSVGGTSTRVVSPGGAYVFRKGTGSQATLAEFSADNGACCLDECKAYTGGVGFNVAMSIEPSQTDGARCVALTCMEDGCSDAYQYPKDDTKTHSCPSSVDFTVTFCPGGSSGATQTQTQTQITGSIANEAQNILTTVQQYTAPEPTTGAPTQPPTEAPTQPPTEAPTQPPTEAPTQPPTEAPTQPPTEAPTQPPTEAPTQPPTDAPTQPPTEAPTEAPTQPPTEAPTASSASASNEVDAGDSQWGEFVGKVGGANETSASSDDVSVGGKGSASEESASRETSITPEPISYKKEGAVMQSSPSTQSLKTNGNDGSVEQVNTQSASDGSSGTAYIVLCIGAAVGAIAVAAIVVIRKKKQALEEIDNKTPAFSMREGAADHSVLMTATNNTSAIL